MKIQYLFGTKRVRQVLGTIYRSDFEGDFGKVLNSFMGEYGSYKKYLDEPHEFLADTYDKYLDGFNKKIVKFDKLYLDWRDTYDNEKKLYVIGERAMDASELAAIEDQNKAQQEREKQQLRELRQKYPDV